MLAATSSSLSLPIHMCGASLREICFSIPLNQRTKTEVLPHSLEAGVRQQPLAGRGAYKIKSGAVVCVQCAV